MVLLTAALLLSQVSVRDLGWEQESTSSVGCERAAAYRRGPLRATLKVIEFPSVAAAKESDARAGSTNAMQFPVPSPTIKRTGLKLFQLAAPKRQYFAHGAIGRIAYEARCKTVRDRPTPTMKGEFEKLVVRLVP
ncbi:hypothetical protein EON82_16075 [bacterium]|nr:MAG: hypothetical protein EON82_16075 [bacterium]